jgi:signal transduction histidine kinase
MKFPFYTTVYAKLASILVFIILISGLIYGFMTFSAMDDYMQQVTQSFNRELAKNLVGERDIVVDGKINREALKQTFHDYMKVNPNIEIYLLDLQGNILSYSADPGQVKRTQVSLAPIYDFMAGQLVLGDNPRSLTEQKAFSVTHVPTQAEAEAYLYIVLRGEEFDQVNQALQTNYFWRYSLWSVLISLTIGLLVGLFLFYHVTRRIRTLSRAMKRFAEQGFHESPDVQMLSSGKQDEIAQLASSFDELAKHTMIQMNKLEEQDNLRRELVANVSHDLRTPLAAMLGYIETLSLKNDTLKESEKKTCLNIAYQHGQRLSRLIDDLFELAKLDAREITLECEIFSFSEFIYDVVQKFQNRASQENIILKLKCPQQALQVYADIALLERVLDNLIGNAFTHSKQGDTILVKVVEDEEIVEITVSDTGCGIAEADLPKIFSRFYKANNQHRKGQHAGLGLAIVKKILALHGQIIEVTSQVNKGTAFNFSLPKG